MSVLALVPLLIILFPLVYNILINNSTFFEDGFITFGNGFQIAISFFQLFLDIGKVLPGRIYPIYVFMISLFVGFVVLFIFRLVMQIVSSVFSVLGLGG